MMIGKTSNQQIQKAYFVHKLFENAAHKHPHAIAVISANQSLTYHELDTKSTALSKLLINQSFDEEIIGISTVRSIDMIIALLAILKAGKAYLPLDPNYPEHRIKQIINDSKIKSCITGEDLNDFFTALDLKVLERSELTETTTPIASSQNPNIYVLYTSGSTGTPKGVYMTHKAMVNLIHWQYENSLAGPGTRTLQFAPLTFDVSFQEIFTTLTSGATLIMINDDLRLDPVNLLKHIETFNIDRIFLPFVALQFLAEAATSTKVYPQCLKEVMTAGEQLKITPQIKEFFKELSHCKLYNQYGPTECHVVTQLALEGPSSDWPLLPNIGVPIWNTSIYIVGPDKNLLPHGETGELAIGGFGLAAGYLNKPDLTNEKFTNILIDGAETRVYLTGDLARYEENETIEFLGRRDDQVKIRGYRIELGEIEVLLNAIEGIKQAVVTAKNDLAGQSKLIAYLLAANTEISTPLVRKQLEEQLPDYMIPSSFVWLDDFPKTTSGKIDKKALPAPEQKRPDISVLYTPPSSVEEKKFAAIWANVLELDTVGIHDNFFELGGNSLLALKTVSLLRSSENIELPITKLYQFPTIAAISAYLNAGNSFQNKKRKYSTSADISQPIAIIGMAGRFPGADTIAELWNVLKQGEETISFFEDNELDSSISMETKKDPLYVKARGIIKDSAFFDASFFGINPKLAEAMDPQQRVFLEISRDVLEKTGHLPAVYDGLIGVFAGSGNNSYYPNNVYGNTDLQMQLGSFQVMTVNEKDYISSRTAYQLDLKGPAVSVFSACSTSLLAVAQAVESLRKNQCDVAIAGGASITSPIKSGHLYQEGAMLSKDGHCRSFDEKATGTVFSDGAGVVLLKTLNNALEDGDIVYGVIKGIGVNNDGSQKGSFTAPSTNGQASAIAMAISDANIDAASISYIETHGTATPLGDPIEIEGLKQAFGPQSNEGYCAIGSIKSNMGHMTAAAGVAGLIKTTLALYHKEIPPSINFDHPNPNIDFKGSPFYVNDKLSNWETEGPRRAGISSFGVGGTNVHVIMEEYDHNQINDPVSDDSPQIFAWSAKSLPSLQKYSDSLKNYVNQSGACLADVAYTLQTTREDFNYRTFVVANNLNELSNSLEWAAGLEVPPLNQLPGETVFLFPGQGAQYINMGKSLYDNEPVYRQAIDECADLLVDLLDKDIRDVLFAEENNDQAVADLNNTKYTQPALFVTEYALAKVWMNRGIVPSILCGHSIGEYVAAHLAGIFSLPDAIKLVAYRGLLISKLPGGSMLSVRAGITDISLPSGLSIAAINSDRLFVASGSDEDIAAFQLVLDGKEILNKKLFTSHAFHSAMMDPVLEDFSKIVSEVKLNRPQKPIVSTVTGQFLTDLDAQSSTYWTNHLRQTVQFSAAVKTIMEMNNPIFIETGPGTVCTTLIYQQGIKTQFSGVASLDNKKTPDSLRSILLALGRVWQLGLNPDWKSLNNTSTRKKLDIPTYNYHKKRYWSETIATPTKNIIIPIENNNKMRKDTLLEKIKQVLENASGIEMDGVNTQQSFLEIGFDSLLLTQVAISLKNEFKLPITFRKLHEEFPNLDLLTAYIDQNTAPDQASSVTLNGQQIHQQAIQTSIPQSPPPVMSGNLPVNDTALGLIAQQLEILSKQVMLMHGQQPGQPVVQANHSAPVMVQQKTENDEISVSEKKELLKPFGATPRIERNTDSLNAVQLGFIKELTERYNAKTAKSKAYAAESRSYMSDPRVVSGFRIQTKELVYPIVINKSDGSRLWDIDGNEYIDALNGFGSNMLGYQHPVIKKAMHDQIDKGYEVGPQHELAARVSKLVCELTGFDRAALCSTGSEAVLGCIRIARTATGRSLIVAFTGSYHGIIDEVLVRGTKKLKSFPAVAGVMPEAVQNILVLDYGTEETLAIIKERAHEIAAVLVEPIQSRRPEFVPIDFVKELREITLNSGTALIFDEVITGFRMHPGGAQAIFGIRADLASYGKVVGAGVPIGVIGGKREFMDALDGGTWQYGDNSFPKVGVTYFAGTFVRHPLALASAKVALEYMKEKGPALQEELNQKGKYLADNLNLEIEKRSLPFFTANYGSLWKIKFHDDVPYAELMFTLMRQKGIHVLDGFPCFITEAMTYNDIDEIIKCFIESMDAMIDAGFFTREVNGSNVERAAVLDASNPPVTGARLGKDSNGNPAWFVQDDKNPGKFLQIQL
ncbi:amino acid adenylation domain-containing protein [Pedobacter sp. ASV1-7]|uniref:amino acid adenylation domain-containing protein n=1 Tax=Pedobacter sp. ASV1-7 TaxID=3145237 RepID=UPI0032E8EED8